MIPKRLRRLGRFAREAALYPAILQGRGASGRRVAFLPVYWKTMCSLLRADRVALELQRRGWQCLIVPPHLDLAQRRRVIAAFDPHVVFIQKSRHPLNDPALYPGRRFVYDLDDADFLDPALTDLMARTCRACEAVIAGSRYVADWCGRYCDDVEVVWTGARPSPEPPPPQLSRAPLVTWAQTTPLEYTAEFAFVTEVMSRVARVFGPLDLRLYDWKPDYDVSRLQPMEAAGVRVERRARMDYDSFVRSLRDTAVGLSPVIVSSEFSRGKSFGKILGYLDAGVPVVTSDEVDHRAVFGPGTAVVTNDPDVWVREIVDLLRSPERRQAMADRAYALYASELTDVVAARKVERVLERIVGREARGASPCPSPAC